MQEKKVNFLVKLDKQGNPEFKLIDFGPTNYEKRSDEVLLKAEIDLLETKTGRDEKGDPKVAPELKGKNIIRSRYEGPGREINFQEAVDNRKNRVRRPLIPLINSPSNSPVKRRLSSPSDSGSPPKIRRGPLKFKQGGRRRTKKKRRKKHR